MAEINLKKPRPNDYHHHVIPSDDYLEHIKHERCTCRPDWDFKNKQLYLRGQVEVKVFIHNRWKDKKQ
jgi:hypothetical protein